MKSDIDTLMETNNLNALLVIGNADHNPAMYYFTGPGHISSATFVKKRHEQGVLYCNDMEREEAAKSGIKVLLYSSINYDELLKEANNDHALASAIRLKRILTEQNVHGRVGLYGKI
jgi:Xaa-Pro aminopeptidase